MGKQLGHLVYGIACLIAAVALCLAAYVAVVDGPSQNGLAIGILATGGILIWIVGRAVRHVLAPPTGPAERPRRAR